MKAKFSERRNGWRSKFLKNFKKAKFSERKNGWRSKFLKLFEFFFEILRRQSLVKEKTDEEVNFKVIKIWEDKV